MLSSFRACVTSSFQSLTLLGRCSFATKMQAGSTKNNKDSAGKRLGVKKFGGHEVYPDDILARQRGFKWHPGKNTFFGTDHTIHAAVEGIVKFQRDPWSKRKRFYINVEPRELPNRKFKPPPPFCYHPELFPELAKNNPEPMNLRVSKPTVPRPTRNVVTGRKVENPVHRVSVAVPGHYLEIKPKETIRTEQLAYEKVKELEETYLGIGNNNSLLTTTKKA